MVGRSVAALRPRAASRIPPRGQPQGSLPGFWLYSSTEEQRSHKPLIWVRFPVEPLSGRDILVTISPVKGVALAPYPKNLPAKYRYHWRHPWTRKAKYSVGFRRWLNKNRYLSPHFRKSEARQRGGNRAWVPRHLLPLARNHAFNLERLRHALGDKPIPVISWYRSRAYNRAIGGASLSQHILARATDHPDSWVDRVGRARVNAAADRIWRDGGVGRYPAGSVHFDSRGTRARWSSF